MKSYENGAVRKKVVALLSKWNQHCFE